MLKKKKKCVMICEVLGLDDAKAVIMDEKEKCKQ